MGVPLLMPRYRRPARGSRRIGMPQRKQEQLAQHIALPFGCVNAGALRRCLAAAVAGRRLIAALAAATFFTCAPAQASPQQDYILYCMGCHGAQAEGVPGKVPPLAHALGRYMRTPEGRNYILRVPGAANSVLSDAQLAAVLNWLAQTFNGDELTSEVPLFTTAEVTSQRHSPLTSVLTTRRDVVRALAATGPAPPASY